MKQITANRKKDMLSDICYLISDNQSGQTLIETVVAIFVLVTALSTGLALSIYALGATRVSQNEIIGSNLAREGVDVVRMMRDSNWLAGDAAGGAYALTTCADLPAGKQQCYPQAFRGPTYNLDQGGGYSTSRYRVQLNPTGNAWQLQGAATQSSQVRLYIDPNTGRYSHNSSSPNVPTNFARQIIVSFNTAAPYTANNPLMIVKSIVAWEGKGCPAFPASGSWFMDAGSNSCRVIVEEHLSNWKDYQ